MLHQQTDFKKWLWKDKLRVVNNKKIKGGGGMLLDLRVYVAAEVTTMEKKINIRVQQNCRTNVTDETKTKIDLKCQ